MTRGARSAPQMTWGRRWNHPFQQSRPQPRTDRRGNHDRRQRRRVIDFQLHPVETNRAGDRGQHAERRAAQNISRQRVRAFSTLGAEETREARNQDSCHAAPRNTHGATNSTPVPPTRTPSRYALIESRPGMPDRNRTVATSAPLSRTVDGRTGELVDENVMIAVSPRGTPLEERSQCPSSPTRGPAASAAEESSRSTARGRESG